MRGWWGDKKTHQTVNCHYLLVSQRNGASVTLPWLSAGPHCQTLSPGALLVARGCAGGAAYRGPGKGMQVNPGASGTGVERAVLDGWQLCTPEVFGLVFLVC